MQYFCDIETVALVESFDQLDLKARELFTKKFASKIEEFAKQAHVNPDAEEILKERGLSIDVGHPVKSYVYRENAAFHAEFAKVLCVSIGFMHKQEFRIKTLIGKNEKAILEELGVFLDNAHSLVAHNGKSFDFPFLFRRYIINGLPVPPILNTIGKKPWEVQLEDTMEMWSSTAWKYTCSLDLLAHVLGLPSPKEGIDGSMIHDLYYFKTGSEELPFDKETANFKTIKEYCELDTVTLANVYFRMKGQQIVKPENVIIT